MNETVDEYFEDDFKVALRLISSRKYEDALDLLPEVLERKLQPRDRGAALYSLAEVHEKLGNIEGAIHFYRESTRYFPGNIYAYSRLKSIFRRKNDKYRYFATSCSYLVNSLPILRERIRFHRRRLLWEEGTE